MVFDEREVYRFFYFSEIYFLTDPKVETEYKISFLI